MAGNQRKKENMNRTITVTDLGKTLEPLVGSELDAVAELHISYGQITVVYAPHPSSGVRTVSTIYIIPDPEPETEPHLEPETDIEHG